MTAENFVPGPYFGDFGGRFVAESLMGPLEEVEAAWKRLCSMDNSNLKSLKPLKPRVRQKRTKVASPTSK